MTQKRSEHACFVDEKTSTIHVMGGYYGEPLKSTESWTFGTDSWISDESSELPIRLSSASAVSANSNEYVGYIAGGETDNSIQLPSVWALRRDDMKWIRLTSKTLEHSRAYSTLLNLQGDQIPGC